MMIVPKETDYVRRQTQRHADDVGAGSVVVKYLWSDWRSAPTVTINQSYWSYKLSYLLLAASSAAHLSAGDEPGHFVSDVVPEAVRERYLHPSSSGWHPLLHHRNPVDKTERHPRQIRQVSATALCRLLYHTTPVVISTSLLSTPPHTFFFFFFFFLNHEVYYILIAFI